MKKKLVAVAILFAAPPAFAQCTDADRKALEVFDRTYGEATNTGNRAQLQTIYADEYQNLGAAASVGKTATIDAAVRAAENARTNPAGAPRINYDWYSIACTPNTATITHRTTVTTNVDGKDQTAYFRSVHFLEKRGGRWQVVANAGAPLDEQGMLAYIEREWNDAIQKHDGAWFERNFAFDATQVPSTSGALMTKAQAVNSVRDDKSVLTALDLSDLNVRTEGNVAVVTGINHAVGRNAEGKPMDRRVRFTDVFIKRDGRWQVWSSQATAIP